MNKKIILIKPKREEKKDEIYILHAMGSRYNMVLETETKELYIREIEEEDCLNIFKKAKLEEFDCILNADIIKEIRDKLLQKIDDNLEKRKVYKKIASNINVDFCKIQAAVTLDKMNKELGEIVLLINDEYGEYI